MSVLIMQRFKLCSVMRYSTQGPWTDLVLRSKTNTLFNSLFLLKKEFPQ